MAKKLKVTEQPYSQHMLEKMQSGGTGLPADVIKGIALPDISKPKKKSSRKKGK